MNNAPVQTRPRRRGVALLLVLTLVAVGTVMSLAVLSLGSMQARTLANAARGARAEYLSESGLQLGLYYLLHPDRSPVALAKSPTRDTLYYAGQKGLAVGGRGDAVDVAVEPAGADGDADLYRVTVVARPADESAEAGAGGSAEPYARRRVVVARVRSAFAFRHAGLFPGDVRLSGQWTVAPASPPRDPSDGGVRADGPILGSLPDDAVDGAVYAANGAAVPGGSARPIFPRAAATRLELSKFGRSWVDASPSPPTYLYGGVACTAQRLGAVANGRTPVPAEWPDRPASTNPGNVWFADVNVRLAAPATLDGTLVVRGARSVYADRDLTVVARPGLPAIVATNDLKFYGSPQVRAVGLVYLVDSVTAESSGATGGMLDVRGALMTSPGATPTANPGVPVADAYRGKVRLTHDPSAVRIPDFSAVDRTPTAVEIVEWDAE